MTNKIQMTEEQARKFFVDIFSDYFDSESETLAALNIAKEKGYILKSELQQKVEEAERMYDYWYSDKETNCEIVIDAMKIAIQLLKQSHPEFKK